MVQYVRISNRGSVDPLEQRHSVLILSLVRMITIRSVVLLVTDREAKLFPQYRYKL